MQALQQRLKLSRHSKKEGIDKRDLGREGFLKRAWEWKEEYGGRIINQLKKLGSSCDWDRLRFTMDEGSNQAVTEVFCRMHEKGWIYKGNRIGNWCPVCKTSISDAEVVYEEQAGHFWHIKYPLIDENGEVSTTEFLEFATTRPETMLGDSAVAVNPSDERYQHLVGRKVLLPIVNRQIPIVADSYVDMEFGTGVVKITPAHDPNDFEVGKRHNLEQINILNDDATINENGGKFEGMDRYEARKAIVKELDDMGLLVRIEDYSHNVGTHDRCGTTIEPMIQKAVVCKDGRADQARSKSSSGEGNPSDSGAHGKDLLQLDGQHQRLVYFQTAVVGTQNSGLLLRFLWRNRGSAHRADCLPEVRRHTFYTGSRYAGYLVFIRAVALLHSRLAGKDEGAGIFLSD